MYAYDEACWEEQQQLSLVRAATAGLAKMQTFWDGQTLVPPQELGPVADMPDIFTAFRKRVEDVAATARPLPAPATLKPTPAMPELPGDQDPLAAVDAPETLHPASAVPFVGGETAGLARLAEYFDPHSPLPRTYKQTRNGLIGVCVRCFFFFFFFFFNLGFLVRVGF